LKTSIVIRTKNEAEHIKKCLDAVFSQNFQAGNFEVLIVDSGSSDDTVGITRNYKVKIAEIGAKKFSYGAALNIGAKLARGEYVVYLSAHAVPKSDKWLSSLISDFSDPNVAGVYGRQVPLSNCNPFEARGILSSYGLTKKVQTKDSFFSNANAAIRRSVWVKFPFNQALPISEDRDWAGRVQASGYKIVYEPKAVVYHSHNYSLGQVFRRSYKRGCANKRIGTRHKLSVISAFARFWVILAEDFSFIFKNRSKIRGSLKWLIIAPVYRLAEYLGLYLGAL